MKSLGDPLVAAAPVRRAGASGDRRGPQLLADVVVQVSRAMRDRSDS
jgi:hypothetical protein